MWLQYHEFKKELTVFLSEANGCFNVTEDLFANDIMLLSKQNRYMCVWLCLGIKRPHGSLKIEFEIRFKRLWSKQTNSDSDEKVLIQYSF